MEVCLSTPARSGRWSLSRSPELLTKALVHECTCAVNWPNDVRSIRKQTAQGLQDMVDCPAAHPPAAYCLSTRDYSVQVAANLAHKIQTCHLVVPRDSESCLMGCRAPKRVTSGVAVCQETINGTTQTVLMSQECCYDASLRLITDGPLLVTYIHR
eukprot:4417429-Amphidinium_carterae.1